MPACNESANPLTCLCFPPPWIFFFRLNSISCAMTYSRGRVRVLLGTLHVLNNSSITLRYFSVWATKAYTALFCLTFDLRGMKTTFQYHNKVIYIGAANARERPRQTKRVSGSWIVRGNSKAWVPLTSNTENNRCVWHTRKQVSWVPLRAWAPATRPLRPVCKWSSWFPSRG